MGTREPQTHEEWLQQEERRRRVLKQAHINDLDRARDAVAKQKEPAALPVFITAWSCTCQRCGHEWVYECGCALVAAIVATEVTEVQYLAPHRKGCSPPARCPNEKCKARTWASTEGRPDGRPTAALAKQRIHEIAEQHKAADAASGREWVCPCLPCKAERGDAFLGKVSRAHRKTPKPRRKKVGRR